MLLHMYEGPLRAIIPFRNDFVPHDKTQWYRILSVNIIFLRFFTVICYTDRFTEEWVHNCSLWIHNYWSCFFMSIKILLTTLYEQYLSVSDKLAQVIHPGFGHSLHDYSSLCSFQTSANSNFHSILVGIRG